MDMWSWLWSVEGELRSNDNDALADYIDSIPSDTCGGRHKKVDQYADEAIALAQASGLGWVEVFLRHWKLQSNVIHRAKPKDMIREAVILLELSSREENQDCPQSVCAVQDLTNCYGCFDGPGYVEERLAVASENIVKINPSWECYTCIATEYASALYDAKRFDDCLDYLKQIDKDLIAYGERKDTGNLLLIKVRVLADQGYFDEARRFAKNAQNNSAGNTFKVLTKIYKSYIEAKAGQVEKAMELLPSFKKAEISLASMDMWSEIVYVAMVNNESFRTKKNIMRLMSIAKDMLERGTYRQAFNLNAQIIDLILHFDFDVDFIVDDLLSEMKEIQKSLHRDEGASKIIQNIIATSS